MLLCRLGNLEADREPVHVATFFRRTFDRAAAAILQASIVRAVSAWFGGLLLLLEFSTSAASRPAGARPVHSAPGGQLQAPASLLLFTPYPHYAGGGSRWSSRLQRKTDQVLPFIAGEVLFSAIENLLSFIEPKDLFPPETGEENHFWERWVIPHPSHSVEKHCFQFSV